MNFKISLKIGLTGALLLVLIACKKDKIKPEENNSATLSNCLLVLNEGLFQQNNASLSKIELQTNAIHSTFFENKTGRPLGDTGNDLQMYDGKIFIVMNVSSTIEVLNASTGASIKQIAMVENGTPKQPRYIRFHGQKGFISCYDGYVDVLNLTSLSIEKRIKVGENPEQLAVSNNKLYVANSGGLNFPNLDSTVSVVSLATETEIKKIAIGKNPSSVVVDSEGDIYAVSRGDYGAEPSKLHRISSVSDTKIETFSFDVERICMGEEQLFVSYLVAGKPKIRVLNTQSESIINSDFADVSSLQTFYGMQWISKQKKLYCFDAQSYVNSGKIVSFSENGVYESSFSVGLIPNSLLYYE